MYRERKAPDIYHGIDKHPDGENLRRVLDEQARTGQRLVIFHADPKRPSDGYTTTGRIGSTTGNRTAITVHNARSLGGFILDCDDIAAIKTSRGGHTLYQRPEA